MKTMINNLKFRSKIICLFGIMIFFSMVISSVLYYNFAARNVEESFKTGAEDVMTQMADTLELRLSTIRQRAQGMLSNYSFMTRLSDYLNNPTDLNAVKAMGDTASYLTDLETGESLIHSTYIYTDKLEFETYVRMRNRDFQFPQSEYYRDYAGEPGNAIRWFPVTRDKIFQDQDLVIPMIWQFSLQNYHGDQYLVIQIRQSELERILNEKYEFFEKIIILDRDGKRIVGPPNLDMESLTALEEGDYLIVHKQLTENGWQIFGLRSKETLLGNLKWLQIIILEIMLVVFVLSTSVVLIFSHQMTESLRRLEQQMSYVQKGDLEVRFFYPYKDEVGSLAKSFNYMVGEIQDLVRKQEETIEELKEERNRADMVQRQKREAELKALQAQINPHFLYNTLNAITWQAADQGAEEISILSSALGRFFRVSLSKGAEIISLREELDHVTSYLEIQSIRYHSKLNYEIDVKEEWMACRVIKLCLQPLAENSIYHGIKEKSHSGLIRIWAEEGQAENQPALCLVVWDDGAGIPKEKLDIINSNLKRGRTDHSEGYGIYNVNERLRLFYGEAYGLRYESEEGRWTKGILTLPIRQ